jgi:hypothetical protein
MDSDRIAELEAQLATTAQRLRDRMWLLDFLFRHPQWTPKRPAANISEWMGAIRSERKTADRKRHLQTVKSHA